MKCFLLLVLLPLLAIGTGFAEEQKFFRAGTARVDVTPEKFPVIVNGGFFPQTVSEVLDPLYVRVLLLHDGAGPLVLAVVDSCVMPRSMVDAVKAEIETETKISAGRIMISTTHCHSAPSLDYVLGSPPDEAYAAWLPGKIVEAVKIAQKRMVPAKIGWAVGDDPNNVFCRLFLMKEGTAATNRFGGTTGDRIRMNPGAANPNKIARTGPADSAVAVISVLTADGMPMAVFSNYSTHYAGVPANCLSGDYFGVFAEEIAERIKERAGKVSDHFLGILSNGSSGDANSIDFLNSKRKFDYKSVGRDVAAAAMAVWPNIEYFDRVPIDATEKRVTIKYRRPTPEEVQAARDHLSKLPDKKPKSVDDVFADGAVRMADWPESFEMPLQAIRLGELALVAIPAQVYGITGLEIKARSPFVPTVVVSLGNGNHGYIPPPEIHARGGYNTWRVHSNCLEVDAEPKIKAAIGEMLRELYENK